MSSMVEPRFLRLLLGDKGKTISTIRWDIGIVKDQAIGVYSTQKKIAQKTI
jgi:hypothetical protein